MMVTLTWSEMTIAWCVAGLRAVTSMHRKQRRRHGQRNGDWATEVEGAMGELAVAKAFNLAWCSFTERGRVDVGDMVQVRACGSPHHKLIIHDDDKGPFVLADLSELPVVHLVGWLPAEECKRAEWWADPQGTNRFAYWAPRDALNDCADLRLQCHRQLTEALP